MTTTAATFGFAAFATARVPLGGWLLGAVLVPARPGASTSGPVLVPEADLMVEVRAGIAASRWRRRRNLEFDAAGLLAAALPALRRLGLADV